jgi:hypothetical protein
VVPCAARQTIAGQIYRIELGAVWRLLCIWARSVRIRRISFVSSEPAETGYTSLSLGSACRADSEWISAGRNVFCNCMCNRTRIRTKIALCEVA